MEGDVVLIKGEAVTKRAAVVQTSTSWFKENKPKVQTSASYFLSLCLILAVEQRSEPEHQPCALSLSEPSSQPSKSLIRRYRNPAIKGAAIHPGLLTFRAENSFAWVPTCLGFCLEGQKTRLDGSPWGLSSDSPAPIQLYSWGLCLVSLKSHTQILSFSLLTCVHTTVYKGTYTDY